MNKAHCLVRAPVWCACMVALGLCACGVEWGAGPACDGEATLRISEVMVTPASGHADEQWVEVENTSNRVASTEGMFLDVAGGLRVAQHAVRDGLVLQPGERGVLVHARAPSSLAFVRDVPVGTFATLNLPRRAAQLRLRCHDAVYDAVAYGSDHGAAPVRGHSLVRTAQAWCVAHGPSYDGTNVGTPGDVNSACNRCEEQGVWRAVQAPTVGDLLITEFVADPSGSGWLEVATTAAAPVDVSTLELTVQTLRGAARRYTPHAHGCRATAPRAYTTFALGPSDAPGALTGPALPRGAVHLTLTVQGMPIATADVGASRDGGGWSLAPQCVDALAPWGQGPAHAYCRHDARCVATPGAANAPCAAPCSGEPP